MDELFGFLSIIVLGCGLYSFYAYFRMKTGGPINEQLLLGRSYEERKCKDRSGFLKKALPAVLVFASAATIYGVIDFIHCYVYSMPVVDAVGMVVFLLVLVGYLVYTSRIKKEYFR